MIGVRAVAALASDLHGVAPIQSVVATLSGVGVCKSGDRDTSVLARSSPSSVKLLNQGASVSGMRWAWLRLAWCCPSSTTLGQLGTGLYRYALRITHTNLITDLQDRPSIDDRSLESRVCWSVFVCRLHSPEPRPHSKATDPIPVFGCIGRLETSAYILECCWSVCSEEEQESEGRSSQSKSCALVTRRCKAERMGEFRKLLLASFGRFYLSTPGFDGLQSR